MNRILLTIAVAVLTATAIVAKNVEVIPCPNQIEVHEGTYVAAGADFRYDTRFDASARDAIIAFADRLSFTAGSKSKVRKGTSDKGFVFAMNPDLPSEALSALTRQTVYDLVWKVHIFPSPASTLHCTGAVPASLLQASPL
jgi:hypothetical protein